MDLTGKVKCSKMVEEMRADTLTFQAGRFTSDKPQSRLLQKSVVFFRPETISEWHRAKLAAV